MKINNIYIGGWFQRTMLQLSEVYDFLRDGTSQLKLNKKKLLELRANLNIGSIEYGVAGEEFIMFNTSEQLRVKIFEDGLIVVSSDQVSEATMFADVERLKGYYEERLSPAINYLFSLGAPVPKELANIETIYPYFIICDDATHEEIAELLAKTERQKYFEFSNKNYSVLRGDKYYFINNKTSSNANIERYVEEQIFIREFKGQLHRYLNLHRIIWEKIDQVKDRNKVKGKDIVKFSTKLDSYAKTINPFDASDNMTTEDAPGEATPDPTPEISADPAETASPEPMPTPSESPEPVETDDPNPSPAPSESEEPAPSNTPDPVESASPAPTPTPTPSTPHYPYYPSYPSTPIVTPAPTPTPEPTPQPSVTKHFSDVPTDFWARDAIDFVTARGLFLGTSDDTFSPEAPMTRAMLMTVLARLDGIDTDGGNTWYAKGIDWAITRGISDGSNPSSNITREQIITMLWRYSGSPRTDAVFTGFTDIDHISDYASTAMQWAISAGVINGFGDGTLRPQNQVTRAEVAQILQNFITINYTN